MALFLSGICLLPVVVLVYLYFASKKTENSDMGLAGKDPDVIDVDLYLSQREK